MLSGDSEWKLTELGLPAPAGALLFRASVELLELDASTGGQYATIKLYQDHNCDGVIGVNTMKGTFYRGMYPEQGGWQKDGMYDSAPVYE